MLNIFHIGSISFENNDTPTELKAIGGIQGYISELISYSYSKGIHVGLIGKIYNYSKKENFSYFQIQSKLSSNIKFLIVLFLKSFVIKIPKNTIIHAHRPDHLAVFIFLKKRKTVVTLHGQQARIIDLRRGKIVNYIYKLMEKYSLEKANALIAVDQVTKDFYSKMYPKYKKKIQIIPTGINTLIFYPLDKNLSRKQLGLSTRDKIIVYVGRISPPKKLDIILAAFSLLVKESKKFKLVIVGDGILLNDLKKLSMQLKLYNNIHFLGVRNRSDLPLIYNAADISVLYSGNEGSPLSVKESLACGIPVVCNAVGDVPNIVINNVNGYIVGEEDILELKDKMKLAIERSEDMKFQCIKSIKKYTLETISQKVLELYKSL